MKRQVLCYFIMFLLLGSSLNGLSQGVGVNATGAAPNGSAMLDVSSSTKGFLLPRVALVSATDPISSPVEGLMVYNNGGSIGPDGFYYFDGTNWVSLAGNSNNHYIGEVFSGGIVFFVDSTGQHGLMASLDDLDGGSGVDFSDTPFDSTGAYSMTDGAANTDSIVLNTTGSAALLCQNHAGGGHSDWYLPSDRELVLLFSNDYHIDRILDNDGNPSTKGLTQETNPNETNVVYWSSTDNGTTNAWVFSPADNYCSPYPKELLSKVRAIRAF